MVEKVKINEYGDCVYTEDYLLELLYSNPEFDVSQLASDCCEQYTRAIKDTGIDLKPLSKPASHPEGIKEFDKNHTEQWFMPESYKTMDIKKYLLERCTDTTEKQRVLDEYELFEKHNFTMVLKFLVYFVDTLRKNNLVWGVGRGSSVSSFCLFLIGVHKINPLIYNLDYREFLR